MKAVIYVRVSTEEQARKGISLDSQEKACKEFAAQQSLTVIKIFREEGRSAKTTKRRELTKLLGFCNDQKGNIARLIVWKVDRFSRNTGDYLYLKMSLKKLGIQIISVTEPIGDSSTGEFLETIFAGFAQFENQLRAERTIGGMVQRIEQGAWPFKAPVGFKLYRDAAERPTLVHDENAASLADFFEYYRQNTPALAEMRKKANELGITLQSGKPITKKYIWKMLRNPVYAGRVTSDLVDGKIFNGLHQGIISSEVFEDIQAILDGRKRNQKRAASKEWPLRGLVKCSDCGHHFTGSSPRGRNGYYPRYSCTHCRSAKTGAPVSMDREAMHEEFKLLLGKLEFSSDEVSSFRKHAMERWNEETKSARAHRRTLEGTIAALKDKRQKVFDLLVSGALTAAEKEEQLVSIEAKLGAAELDFAGAAGEEMDKEVALEYAVNFLGNISKLWEDAEPIERARLQQLTFPDGISYKFSEGFRTADLWLKEVKNIGESGSRKVENDSMVTPSSQIWNHLLQVCQLSGYNL